MNNYDLIGMAWADKISFEEIKKRTGFSEKEVIAVMRRKLKKKKLYIMEKKSKRQIYQT